MYIWQLNKCFGNELKSPSYTEMGCVGPSVTQGSADECRGRNTCSYSTERECYQSFNHTLVTRNDLIRNNTKINIGMVGKSSNIKSSSIAIKSSHPGEAHTFIPIISNTHHFRHQQIA